MLNKGSGYWAVWHLKAVGLPRLIEDLEKLERAGYPEVRCRALKNMLRKIIQLTNEAHGSLWRPCMMAELHEFFSIYERWNDRDEGADLIDRIHRRQRIEEMRAIRKQGGRNVSRALKNATLKSQIDIGSDEDHKLAAGIYREMRALVDEFPDTFRVLRTAIEAFFGEPLASSTVR